MLKNTPPAARVREATAEELAAYVASNARRIAATNRALFLLGSLTPVELDGAIVLLEAVHRDRRALSYMTPERGDLALASALPGDVW